MRILNGSLLVWVGLGLGAQAPKLPPPPKAAPLRPVTKPLAQATAPTDVQVLLRQELPGKELLRSPVLVRRDDGRIVLAWEEFTPRMELLGQAQLRDETLGVLSGAVATTNPRPEYFGEVHSAVTFANGNLLVAFNEAKDARVKLALFDSGMKPLKGLFPLAAAAVSHLAFARLSGGNTAAVVYFDGQMRMAVLNAQGEFALPPTAVIGDLHSDSIQALAAATLPNGLILVAYTPAFLTTALLDPLGNNVRAPKRLATNPQAIGLSVTPLEGDRAVIGFLDLKDSKYAATLVPVNAQGDLTGSFSRLWDRPAMGLRPVRLSGGDLLVLLVPTDAPTGNGLGLLVADPDGRVKRGPTLIETAFHFSERSQGLLALPGDRALLCFSGYNHPLKDSAFLILK